MVFSSIEFLWLFMPVVLAAYLVVAAALAQRAAGGRQPRLLRLGRARVPVRVPREHRAQLRRRAADRAARERGRRPERAKRRCGAAIVFNLALLFAWKYTVFAVEQLERACSAGRRPAIPRAVDRAADRHLVLHVPRHLATSSTSTAATRGRCADPVDFAHYMALFPQLIAGPIVRYHEIDDQIRTPPPRASGSTTSPTGFPRFALGPVQEGADRRPGRADRRRRVRAAGGDADDGRRPGSAPSPTRCRSTSTSPATPTWRSASARMFGFRFPENFDRPVLGRVDHRLLAALAHDAVALVPRLRLHPARRQSRGADATTVPQPADRLPAHRPLARRGLDLRGLGPLPRRAAGRRAAHRRRRAAPTTALARPRARVTFLLVVFGWVLFRADDARRGRRLLRARCCRSTSAAAADASTPR